MSNDKYILEIEWDATVNIPRLVGPFDSRKEAEEWGELNVPNGVWNVATLSYPYMRSSGQRQEQP